MGFLDWAKAPVINDVSTSVDDPPAYAGPAADLHPAALADALKASIRSGYAHLAPLSLPGDAAAVLAAARRVIAAQPRAEVVHEGEGTVEAVFTTKLMKFKDDLVVR